MSTARNHAKALKYYYEKPILLQRNAALFTGADTHDIFNIGDKDPAYADVVGVQHVLCGFDDLPDGYLADYKDI